MTSPTWIEPPPRRQTGMGCLGKGCLILVAFVILLALAFTGGTIYAVRHLRATFFAKQNVQLPPSTATEQEQQLALANWKLFERSARAHAQARIEMTADELNALIASEPKLRGKAFVSIDNDTARLQLSFPLDDVRWLRGHYVNGECTVQSAPNKEPAQAKITHVVLNGHVVDDAALAWRFPWSLRGYLSKWAEEDDLKTFEIREGKVILETKGSG